MSTPQSPLASAIQTAVPVMNSIQQAKYQVADMEKKNAFDQQKIAIVGPQKSGKSRLASTGIKPILFGDLDGRKEAVSGIKGVYAITLQDPADSWIMPTVTEGCFDILDVLEKNKLDIHALDNKIPEGTILKTLVWDSATWLAKANLKAVLYANKGSVRELPIGSGRLTSQQMFRVSKSYDGWMADVATTEKILLRSFALGVSVIMTFHEDAEETAQSTSEHKSFTGKKTIEPARYIQLLSLFNEVWHMESKLSISKPGAYEPVVRVMQAQDFNSATCLNLDPVEAPNIEAMILKHKSRNK